MPFKKGDPNINRKGRTAGRIDAVTALDRHGNRDEAMGMLWAMARGGDVKCVLRINEYYFGTPQQSMDLTTQGEKITVPQPDISTLTPEAIKKISDAIDAIKTGD